MHFFSLCKYKTATNTKNRRGSRAMARRLRNGCSGACSKGIRTLRAFFRHAYNIRVRCVGTRALGWFSWVGQWPKTVGRNRSEQQRRTARVREYNGEKKKKQRRSSQLRKSLRDTHKNAEKTKTGEGRGAGGDTWAKSLDRQRWLAAKPRTQPGLIRVVAVAAAAATKFSAKRLFACPLTKLTI